MGKAAIQAQIDAKRGEITNLNSQISRLEECKKALTDFSTDIEYVLTSNEHIETTYYLAGTPYLNETNNEEKILKTAKQKLSAKSDDVVAKLTQKISELETEKSGISLSISWLEIEKSLTTEE
ncbi:MULTISPECIES: DUF5082 family protein [Streptococcus]|jgi:hypothetical protein|uniref:DUF5082 family protein n=1 Tax=Streptococcus TaxID=1301 RepID=UPI0008A3B2FC|nr:MULTISPECIES: DUF5082 family protein [Streptococcus]RKV88236.1 MAG: DUF5082 domain-containing protein [Streptococcus sp.]MBU6872446.1 DUF5082 domain-containing protein [Streptococcus oralis]OFL51547.1 hypothetical protein HMPREF2766_03685 [Streptococcus sp. HMSC076C08]OFP31880.1 hypothetical protein HMPREF2991_03360 [Streptococcus sp. HMSC072D07]UTX65884.1 DUF5082 domain-containing protein [Streptococcus oralis]